MIGTLSNNSLNAPLRTITRDFHAQVASGVLVVSSFIIVLAAGIAVSGWVGDRFGRRRTLAAALALMTAAQAGAALAPSLAFLIGLRALQGLACSAIPPSVMGLLSTCYPRNRRARVMGAWAAANGFGQAVGAPFGGLVADYWGWRTIFWALVPVTLVVLAGTSALPHDSSREVRLHWTGALTLTGGALVVMTGLAAIPQHAVPTWTVAAAVACGAGLLTAFVVVSNRSAEPIVRPVLLGEPRFMRSTLAAFAQMFALAVVLIAVPLYLTGPLGRSTGEAGIAVFALPLTMTLLAPVVGLLSERGRPRLILRTGLTVLMFACLGLGLLAAATEGGLAAIVVLLVVVGVGIAFVQTPAATGATRSPAGQTGAALGVFNMMRFAGSAVGAAWVAIIYPQNVSVVLYAGPAVLLVIALMASFLGPQPAPDATAPSDLTAVPS